jgi:HSP20 family protein
VKEEKKEIKEKIEIKKGDVEEKSEMGKVQVESRKSVAERMLEDMVKNIREMQTDLESRISEYASSVPEKPMMDLIETNDTIVIKTDLPGVKKEDITINLTEDSIGVMAKFEEKHEIEEANYIKRERKYGEAQREMVLPTKVKIEEATAKFENGVLTVELPKLEVKEKFEVKID